MFIFADKLPDHDSAFAVIFSTFEVIKIHSPVGLSTLDFLVGGPSGDQGHPKVEVKKIYGTFQKLEKGAEGQWSEGIQGGLTRSLPRVGSPPEKEARGQEWLVTGDHSTPPCTISYCPLRRSRLI